MEVKKYMKRVAYIGGFQLPDKNAAALRVLANTEILEKIGYEVVFLGSSEKQFVHGEYSRSRDASMKETLFECGYPSKFLEWVRYETSVRNIAGILDKITNLKAIICYDCPSIVLYRLIQRYHPKNVKVISDTSEWFSFEGKNFFHATLKYFDTTFRMKFVNNKTDGLIVTSTFLMRHYKNKSVAVIPTLIPKRVREFKNAFYDKGVPPALDPRDINIIYAGIPFRIGTRIKNRSKMKDRLDISLRLLLRAKTMGARFCFHVFGITEREYLLSLPEDSWVLDRLSGSVVFHGRSPNTVVRQYVKCSDFSILLRDNNVRSNVGFPTKVSESITLGTPVITTRTSDLPKYVLDGKNGFFIDKFNGEIDEEKFLNILTMSKSDINEMKAYCKNDHTFDPENWIDEMRKVLE